MGISIPMYMKIYPMSPRACANADSSLSLDLQEPHGHTEHIRIDGRGRLLFFSVYLPETILEDLQNCVVLSRVWTVCVAGVIETRGDLDTVSGCVKQFLVESRTWWRSSL